MRKPAEVTNVPSTFAERGVRHTHACTNAHRTELIQRPEATWYQRIANKSKRASVTRVTPLHTRHPRLPGTQEAFRPTHMAFSFNKEPSELGNVPDSWFESRNLRTPNQSNHRTQSPNRNQVERTRWGSLRHTHTHTHTHHHTHLHTSVAHVTCVSAQQLVVARNASDAHTPGRTESCRVKAARKRDLTIHCTSARQSRFRDVQVEVLQRADELTCT